MSKPVGDYCLGVCYLQVDGTVRLFADELALERFIVRCPHDETVVAGSWGLQFCTRCWAIPRKKVSA